MGRRHCAAISVIILMVLALLTYSVEWSRLPKRMVLMGEGLSCATSVYNAAETVGTKKHPTNYVSNHNLSRPLSWMRQTKVGIACKKSVLNEVQAAAGREKWNTYHLILESKNPCWWQNALVDNNTVSQLNCLPNFFLAGVSKCGSTDIFNRLNRHPQVLQPSRKEPSWFDWRRFSPDLHPFEWYLSTFQTAATEILKDIQNLRASKRVVGDGSPTYFWRNFHWDQYPDNAECLEPQVVNPHAIHRLLPHAKIILSFRNPVNSIYSKYLSMADREFLRSPELFHLLVVKEVKRYLDCFAHSSIRSCAYNTTLSSRAKVRLEKGLYAIFLSDWFRVFPHNQIHIIRFEDYITDIYSHLHKMFSFLQLDEVSDSVLHEISMLPPSNPGRHYNVGPMLAETRLLLEKFYSPFNQQLADMLSNKAFLWTS